MSQPQNKKKGGCLKWGAITAGVLLLLGLIFGSSDDKEGSNSASDSGSSSAPAQDAANNGSDAPAGQAPAEQDATTEGAVAIGETANMSRMDVTVNNFRNAGTSVFGDTNLCADVSFVNKSDKTLGLNQFDWKLTDPAGVTRDTTISEFSDFDTVDLNPGANYAGTICFDGEGAPGEYTLKFTEGFIGGTAEWKGNL